MNLYILKIPKGIIWNKLEKYVCHISKERATKIEKYISNHSKIISFMYNENQKPSIISK